MKNYHALKPEEMMTLFGQIHGYYESLSFLKWYNDHFKQYKVLHGTNTTREDFYDWMHKKYQSEGER